MKIIFNRESDLRVKKTLTYLKEYDVIDIGETDYFIMNDKRIKRWYNKKLFTAPASSLPEGEQRESQASLWREVVDKVLNDSTWYNEGVREYLPEHFTINRK